MATKKTQDTRQTELPMSDTRSLFPVARAGGIAAVRAALAAVEPSGPGEPSIAQRYSRAQTERARRGIAQARRELDHAALAA